MDADDIFNALNAANAADAEYFAAAEANDLPPFLDFSDLVALDEVDPPEIDYFALLRAANEQDAAAFAAAEAADNVSLPDLSELLSLCNELPMQGGSGPNLHVASQSPVVITQHDRLQMTEYSTRLAINHNLPNHSVDIMLIAPEIDAQFDAVVQPIIANAAPHDYIAISVSHPELKKGDMFDYYRRDNFTTVRITNKIAKLIQSCETFLPTGSFNLIVSIFRSVTGGALTSAPQTVEANRSRCLSLFQVKSRNQECGHIAVFVAMVQLKYKLSGRDQSEWNRIKRSNDTMSDLIQILAREHVTDTNAKLGATGVICYDEEVDMAALELYAKAWRVQVVVYSTYTGQSRTSAQLLFISNHRESADRTIFLELLKYGSVNHFNVITSISGYLGVRKFCHVCYKGLSNVEHHVCRSGCPGCGQRDVCPAGEDFDVRCSDCGQKCASEQCLSMHLQGGKCRQRQQCPDCLVHVAIREFPKHKCLVYECHACQQEYTETPHFCYMKPIPVDEAIESRNIVIVAFDIESKFVAHSHCDQDGVHRTTTYHEPDLLCALIVCNLCYISENVRSQDESGKFRPLKELNCALCREYRVEFTGRDCVRHFADYLFLTLGPHVAKADKSVMIKVFAHNFKGYDGRFLLRDLFNRKMEKQRMIMQGSKVTYVKIGNISFQDSLNLFQCPLAKLPKSFGFEQRVLKGHFPYLFNTPENAGYVGPTPQLHFYGHENMKPAQQKEIERYHASVAHRVDFDLEQEKLLYCRDDTEILLIAVQEFRSAFLAVAKFESIRQYFTLPSMSYGGFRRNELQEKTIGVTPMQGYGKYRKSSKFAHAVLDVIESETGHTIKREQRFGYAYADGYDAASKTMYEVHGCYWHGCPSCHPHRRDQKRSGSALTLDQAYKKTVEKQEYFRRLKKLIPDLTLVELWGCQINQRKRSDHTFRINLKAREEYYDKLEQVGGCDLRGGYYGGRTNNRKFIVECDGESSWLEYQDFTSLYPAVLAKYTYMIGHPTVVRKDFDKYVDSSCTAFKQPVFGFVKCTVVPPKRLQFPILPARIHDRLMFVLCRTCAHEKARTLCRHSDQERALTDTFATPELEEALAHGYRITDVIEILHWEQQSSELFKPFVYKWLKIKQEASGYPSWAVTEQQKAQYVNDYKEQQGIELDPTKIERNEIVREMAKRQLNSFYGKFAENENKEQAELVSTYQRMHQLMSDPKIIVTGAVTVSEDNIFVNWRYVNNEDARQGVVNVAIASFITSYARRELWRALNTVEERCPGSVAYFDTDSIIYRATPSMEVLPTGSLLGELTSEVGAGERMIKLVALGPKNYAYVVRKNDGSTYSVVKVKGITLTAKALQLLTVEKLKEIAEQYCLHPDEEQVKVSIFQSRIGCDPKHQLVYQQEMYKVYRAVSEKRIVIGNDTLPFGWQEEEEAQPCSNSVNESDLDLLISFLE